jgi:hypothetical protein
VSVHSLTLAHTPSHILTLPGVCDVIPGLLLALIHGLPLALTPRLPLGLTPGLPFGSQPYNPFALVTSPKLGLRHSPPLEEEINVLIDTYNFFQQL